MLDEYELMDEKLISKYALDKYQSHSNEYPTYYKLISFGVMDLFEQNYHSFESISTHEIQYILFGELYLTSSEKDLPLNPLKIKCYIRQYYVECSKAQGSLWVMSSDNIWYQLTLPCHVNYEPFLHSIFTQPTLISIINQTTPSLVESQPNKLSFLSLSDYFIYDNSKNPINLLHWDTEQHPLLHVTGLIPLKSTSSFIRIHVHIISYEYRLNNSSDLSQEQGLWIETIDHVWIKLLENTPNTLYIEQSAWFLPGNIGLATFLSFDKPNKYYDEKILLLQDVIVTNFEGQISHFLLPNDLSKTSYMYSIQGKLNCRPHQLDLVKIRIYINDYLIDIGRKKNTIPILFYRSMNQIEMINVLFQIGSFSMSYLSVLSVLPMVTMLTTSSTTLSTSLTTSLSTSTTTTFTTLPITTSTISSSSSKKKHHSNLDPLSLLVKEYDWPTDDDSNDIWRKLTEFFVMDSNKKTYYNAFFDGNITDAYGRGQLIPQNTQLQPLKIQLYPELYSIDYGKAKYNDPNKGLWHQDFAGNWYKLLQPPAKEYEELGNEAFYKVNEFLKLYDSIVYQKQFVTIEKKNDFKICTKDIQTLYCTLHTLLQKQEKNKPSADELFSLTFIANHKTFVLENLTGFHEKKSKIFLTSIQKLTLQKAMEIEQNPTLFAQKLPLPDESDNESSSSASSPKESKKKKSTTTSSSTLPTTSSSSDIKTTNQKRKRIELSSDEEEESDEEDEEDNSSTSSGSRTEINYSRNYLQQHPSKHSKKSTSSQYKSKDKRSLMSTSSSSFYSSKHQMDIPLLIEPPILQDYTSELPRFSFSEYPEDLNNSTNQGLSSPTIVFKDNNTMLCPYCKSLKKKPTCTSRVHIDGHPLRFNPEKGFHPVIESPFNNSSSNNSSNNSNSGNNRSFNPRDPRVQQFRSPEHYE